MAFAATDCVDDAIDAARDFLQPVDRGRWLRLGVIVFFLAAGSSLGSIPSVGGQAGTSTFDWEWTTDAGEFTWPDIAPDVWLAIGAVVALAVALALVFGLVSATMEFVLVEALRTETVRVRAPFRRYLRAGLSLFAFQVVLFVALIAIPLGGLGLLVLAPALTGGANLATIAGIVVLMVLVGIVLFFLTVLVHGFTVDFVVQIMVAEECGVLAGWRQFWPILRGNLAEFAVYVVLRWIIVIAVGFITGIVTGVASIVVLIPLGVLAAVLFFGTGGAITVGTIVGYALLGILFVLVMIGVAAIVQVPLQTFTRYYELLVLGDVAEEYDLIPERRAAIRAPDDAASASAPGG